MKVDKPKKLTKKDIKEEERKEKLKKYFETAKWTPAVARLKQKLFESNWMDRHIAFQKAWRSGDIYEGLSESDSSTDSEVVRVCESPKKQEAAEGAASLADKRTKASQKRFFSKILEPEPQKCYVMLAPDTMEPAFSEEEPEIKGTKFINMSQVLFFSVTSLNFI